MGSWELYKAKKSFTELKITEENYIAKKRLNLTKIALGGVKMIILGLATDKVALPILQSNITNYNDLAILASFAAGYAVLVTSMLNTNILNDEAFNYKHIQGKLLNNVNIISKYLNFDSFKDVVVIKPIKKKWFSNNKID